MHRVTGDGPPIVFIHGAAASARLFGAQFQAFRNHARCYFINLPGHGGVPAHSDLSIEGYASFLGEFLNTLNEPAALVGHSMGGAVAILTAFQNPELVRGLALTGSGCRLPVSDELLSALEYDYSRALDLVVSGSYTKHADPRLLERARAEIVQTPPDVVRADFITCSRFDGCDKASKIKTPTVIICGEQDLMTPLPLSKHLNALISGSRLIMIPGGSHMVMVEFVDTFDAILIDAHLNSWSRRSEV